jgi:hypothetical protein
LDLRRSQPDARANTKAIRARDPSETCNSPGSNRWPTVLTGMAALPLLAARRRAGGSVSKMPVRTRMQVSLRVPLRWLRDSDGGHGEARAFNSARKLGPGSLLAAVLPHEPNHVAVEVREQEHGEAAKNEREGVCLAERRDDQDGHGRHYERH